MNGFGILYGVFAPIVSGGNGTPLAYGTTTVIEGMRQADLSIDRSGDPLYGDNTIKEMDNGINGGTLTVSATGVTLEKEAALLGLVKEGTAPNEYYDETGEAGPAGGFGYLRLVKESGVKKWIAHWIHKLYFAKKSETAATKAGAISWTTPVYEGTMCGVDLDGTGVERFRRRPVEFASYAAAKAYIDGMAGIPISQVATPVATPIAGEVASGAEIALSCETEGATIYYTTDGSTPTSGSMAYAAPLHVYEATTIKAIAVKAGMTNSSVLSAAYTISA